MSEVRSASQVVSLVFGIYVRLVNLQPAAGESPRHTYLLVYLLTANDRTLLRKRKIALTPGETGKWYTFTLRTEEVQHWISTPESNYGLLVQGSDGRGQPVTVVVPQNTDEEPLVRFTTKNGG